MDYFASETNQWLSPEERRALKQREDELREVRKGSRLSKKKFTLDFAGRRLLEEGEEGESLKRECVAHVNSLIN